MSNLKQVEAGQLYWLELECALTSGSRPYVVMLIEGDKAILKPLTTNVAVLNNERLGLKLEPNEDNNLKVASAISYHLHYDVPVSDLTNPMGKLSNEQLERFEEYKKTVI